MNDNTLSLVRTISEEMRNAKYELATLGRASDEERDIKNELLFLLTGKLLRSLSLHFKGVLEPADRDCFEIVLAELADIEAGNKPTFIKSFRSPSNRPVKLSHAYDEACYAAAIQSLVLGGKHIQDALETVHIASKVPKHDLKRIRKLFQERRRGEKAQLFFDHLMLLSKEAEDGRVGFAVRLIAKQKGK